MRISRKKMLAHELGRLWKFLASKAYTWVDGGHAADNLTITTSRAATNPKPPRH